MSHAARVFILALGVASVPLAAAKAADLFSGFPSMPTLTTPVSPYQTGFYFGGRQMLGGTNDTSFLTNGGATSFTNRYEFARLSGAFLGYGFGPVFGFAAPRVEIEGSFGSQSVNRHTVNGVRASTTDSFGDLRTYTGLLNGYLDFNAGQLASAERNSFWWRVTPFVGGGVGMSNVNLRRQGVSSTGVVMDNSDTRFTWQASVGVGVQIFDKTSLEIAYRHMRTEGLSFTAIDGTVSKTNLINNLATIGIRRSF